MTVITTLPIQIHPQGQPITDSFSLRLPSQVILDCVKVTTKTDHHRGGPGYQKGTKFIWLSVSSYSIAWWGSQKDLLRLLSQVILYSVKVTIEADHHRGPGYQDEKDVWLFLLLTSVALGKVWHQPCGRVKYGNKLETFLLNSVCGHVLSA